MKHLIALFLSIPQSLMAGFVFSTTWNWFIVRKFETLPRLNTLDAVGILCVWGVLLAPLVYMQMWREAKDDLKKTSKKDEEGSSRDDGTISIVLSIAMTLFVYPLMLGIDALWHLIIR